MFHEGFLSDPLADVGSVIEVGHPMAFIVNDAAEVKMPMSIDAKAMIALETADMIKLVADKASQKIIGVHFLADHTDTLIGAAVVSKAAAHGESQVTHTQLHPPCRGKISNGHL